MLVCGELLVEHILSIHQRAGCEALNLLGKDAHLRANGEVVCEASITQLLDLVSYAGNRDSQVVVQASYARLIVFELSLVSLEYGY